MSGSGLSRAGDLRMRVQRYLETHHTMTLATVDLRATGAVHMPVGNAVHAVTVFYAVDELLRLVFLSKTSSLHGSHIGKSAPVAVTVTEDYRDWKAIQGVQAWGEARLLTGGAKIGAMVVYLRRFPFVGELLREPGSVEIARGLGVYRMEPTRVAFTDNTTGVFGREILELVVD